MKAETVLEKTLACLLKDPDFFQRFFPLIPDELFTDSNQMYERVWSYLRGYWLKYGHGPEALENFLEMLLMPMDEWSAPSPDEQMGLFSFMQRVLQDPLRDKEWLIDGLQTEIQRIRINKIDLTSLSSIESPDEFRERIVELGKELHNIQGLTFETNLGTAIVADLDDRLLRRQIESETPLRVIPTLMGSLDDSLDDGGVAMESLCVLAGRTGTGKSIGLVHIAKAAMVGGFKVLFVTLELSGREVEKRIDSSLTRIEMSDLVAEVDLLKQQFNRWTNRRKHESEIRVVVGIPRKFTVAELNWTLDQLKREKNFEPQIVIVDYADLMKMEGTGKRYEILSDLFLDLKGVAMERKIVVWTASQVNREGGKEDIAGTEHLSDSDAKAAHSDLVLTINLTDNTPIDGEFFLHCAKNRIGPELAKPLRLFRNFKTMLFDKDSSALL